MQNRTHEFVFSDGTKVTIKKISQFLISGLFNNTADELPVPMIKTTVGTRKEEKLIPDYNNPAYNRLYTDRQNKDQQRAIRNIAVVAVVDDVPDSLRKEFEDMAYMIHGPNYDERELKKLWIMSLLDDEEEMGRFQEAVLGLSSVTGAGIEESAKRFQGDS